jgi:murein DD-endopeptidase MepM/ murein hydrolase activator NlpD
LRRPSRPFAAPLAALVGSLALFASGSAHAGTWADVATLPGWPAGAATAPTPVQLFPALGAFTAPTDDEETRLPDAPAELRLGELSLFAPIDDEAASVPGCELVFDDGAGGDTWQSNLWIGAPWPKIVKNGHTEKNGEWIEYDQIGRRWDRPASYAAYRYPLANTFVVSGYDLDKPDDLQRRGRMNAVGHGGVDLPEKKGTPISLVALDHQVGDAEVLFVGHLFGETVVTRHTVREGGRKRDYVLLFGHLDEAAEGVRRGRRLRAGQLVGYVGNTDSPEFVHLHLEARRLREGVDPWKVAPWNINAREISVVTDPRNVLPLVAPRKAKPKCTPSLFAQTTTRPQVKTWLPSFKLSLETAPESAPAP